jgi:hypothetical protein
MHPACVKRAELVRGLLTRGLPPTRRDALLLGSRSSGVGGLTGSGAISWLAALPGLRAESGAGAVGRGGLENAAGAIPTCPAAY